MAEIQDEKTTSPPQEEAVSDGSTGPATASNGNVLDGGLQRGLKNRHLQMISLGGVVGASIWFGTGSAVAYSGPVGALLCFFIVGVDVFFVMQSLGEMSTLFPIQGAFVELAGRFVDPALAFSLGWNYWYLWVTNIANDYNNISLVLQNWTGRVPGYGWILLFWAFFSGTSLLGVVVWGEMEFYFAAWKLLCVIVVGFLLGILVNTGAIGGEYVGFRYWADPGPIANGIGGFGQTFVLAAVYYCGTEMLAFTAAESRDPRRDLPRAIRQTFWRILVVFLGLVFFAGLLVPSTAPDLLGATSKAAKSPWTIALVRAGWPGAGHLLNVVMITAQFSSVNSAIYISSRTLVALARNGRAPRFLGATTDSGTPVRAIVLSHALGLLSILNTAAGPGKVFTYLVDISGAATFVAWAMVGLTHLRLRAAWARQGRGLDELPYRALLYPYGAWFVLVINTFLVLIYGYSVFVGGFKAVDFVFSYVVVAIFAVLYVFWKVLKGTKIVPLMEMDLVTGRREYIRRDTSVAGEDPGIGTEKEKSVPWYIKVKRIIFA
ncbi:uncharacterized protein JN550_007018 [Neoarthrinium moseri]|uniref:uncharacterized protein n=1 Tax=Neoarthrinium moseri TaxID=1658444 RepID=UPI001FDE47EF|nr:uncharacterized protein JN550_007018 [Neoarthrinium moseri]KAI1867287.1 hypothetical protein JN550_007018 [Neoarthrinium moseri]